MVLVWLLLLAASPITAPFTSCDLGDVTPGAPFHGSAVKSKGVDPQQPCVAAFIEDLSYVDGRLELAGRGGFAQRVIQTRLIVPLRI